MKIRPLPTAEGYDKAAEDKGEGEMTQIRGFIGATRRSGELGVHSLDEFNLVVPDMKLAEMFYGEFGLELRSTHCA